MYVRGKSSHKHNQQRSTSCPYVVQDREMELSVACKILREKRGHHVCGQDVKHHDCQRKSTVRLYKNTEHNKHRLWVRLYLANSRTSCMFEHHKDSDQNSNRLNQQKKSMIIPCAVGSNIWHTQLFGSSPQYLTPKY